MTARSLAFKSGMLPTTSKFLRSSRGPSSELPARPKEGARWIAPDPVEETRCNDGARFTDGARFRPEADVLDAVEPAPSIDALLSKDGACLTMVQGATAAPMYISCDAGARQP
jgi:hypothetical protein